MMENDLEAASPRWPTSVPASIATVARELDLAIDICINSPFVQILETFKEIKLPQHKKSCSTTSIRYHHDPGVPYNFGGEFLRLKTMTELILK